nr:GDSL-type esterase/lipase family protein [Leucobacter weissii]
MNGVTGSVLQTAKHLANRGHELMIVAPNAGPIHGDLHGAETTLLPSFPFPSYPQVRVTPVSAGRVARLLRSYEPDAVHLASPLVLGWAGVRAADALRIPSVAVYQTDIAAYTEKYRMPGVTPLAEARIARLHRKSTLTLAPSSSAIDFLTGLDVDRLRRWGRGVDADRFAPERRSEAWRRSIGRGKVVVGYVGRLSPEKQVEDLAALHDLPGVRLVIVGDGPSRPALERLMPDAHFTGFLGGIELAEAVASFDLFVHTGESETFCQTVQEALASGVPVVATGVGGPVDLVQNSVNGWLYRPGDLAEMRARVTDLAGDPAKRASFSAAARRSVLGRSWASLGDQLLAHYDEAIELRRIDDALLARPRVRPRSEPRPAADPTVPPRRWKRYIALGDSITEGLCDSSRMPRGEFQGWAARLAMLLAHSGPDRGIRFANLAVRSRRVKHIEEQVDQALPLRPDLVSILVGANDLVLSRLDIDDLAHRLETQVARLRASGAEVLLGTPFLPRRRAALVLAKRFAEFNTHVRRIAREHACLLLDVDTIPEVGDLEMWAEDRVHLTSAGHRLLAYRAAAVLGVPNAAELGGLEHALHDDSDGSEEASGVSWLRAHALPWVWRRVRGRTAGDGLSAKHTDYVELRPNQPSTV